MTLTQLEYILAVESTGSFSKAAKQCFVTQPTLSMQIRKLEEELGVVIFDRGRQPVVPTLVGLEILKQARESVRGMLRIDDVIREHQKVVHGELRLGIIPTLASCLLPLFLNEFLAHYREIKLVVEELLTDQIVRRLKHDELDVAIIVTPLYDPEIIESPLFYEEFVVYLSPNHEFARQKTIELDRLDGHEMVLLSEGHCFRNQVLRLCRDSMIGSSTRRLRFESGSLDTLRRVVERGYGYTLLPELAVQELSVSEKRHVRRLKRPAPTREVSLVMHRSLAKKTIVDALRDEIIARIPERMKRKHGTVTEWKL